MTQEIHEGPIMVTRVQNGFLVAPMVLEGGRYQEQQKLIAGSVVVVEMDDPEDLGVAIFGMMGVEKGRVKQLFRVGKA